MTGDDTQGPPAPPSAPWRSGPSWRDALLAIYVVVCALALVWPVYPWVAARVAPLVLGVPFALAWNVGWIVATSVAVAVYHFSDPGLDGP